MTYNGWSNKFTWDVFTCLTNDEGLYKQALQSVKEGGIPELREFVKDYLHQHSDGDTFLTELITDALDDVVWWEVADALQSQ
ncbi:hypothetical protein [Caldanaerobius polysaccharolyticus]|uniref:hypothetical protein n=1 Tax=Caldanaerobius polysaccharolyticus TaxID=44256 RepID=UPI00054E7112|nr:hypothetical protein [Caldanaerobius polysaccharolyticus]